MARTVG